MEKTTLETLEYGQVVQMLKDCCQSDFGRSKAGQIRPIKDLEAVNLLQEETQDALALMARKGNPPLFGIYDLQMAYRRAQMGGTLIPKQLLQIGDMLRVSRQLRDYASETGSGNVIVDRIRGLYANRSLETAIERIIIGPEEIADDASSELLRIRRSIHNKTQQIRQRLQETISNRQNENILQEQLITIREGRYVLPVRSGARNAVKGIVHDQSGSGSTVFIEPMFVVELNNELRALELDEREEIERILAKLSIQVAESAEELIVNQSILGDLDVIFARARLAGKMKASRPLLNNDGIIDLKEAKHPLLPGKVVPIDVRIGEDFRTLVITGPNTGGKTVTLKTIGLLTLMAMSGLHIPCSENSKIAVFNQIFTDIGDKQSIEQSLSTFSSSMTNIVSILDQLEDNALVLFDELGAGTDPTEGAALAMAILDTVTRRKSVRTVATTHYSPLKLYAISTEGVQNAAVEFDVDTLSPTYRLIIGAPGKSNAFEISRRLGLDPSIIERAAASINEEHASFEDVLAQIEDDRRMMEAEREAAESQRQEVENLKRKLSLDLDRAERDREKQRIQAQEQAREILKKARQEADDLIRSLRSMETLSTSDRDRQITEINEHFKQQMEMLGPEESPLDIKSDQAPQNVKVGDSVKVLAFDQIGTVLTDPDKNGDIQVQLGILKVNANLSNVERVKDRHEVQSENRIKEIIREKSKEDVSTEVDLRGMTLDEAIDELEKYLDNAILVSIPVIRIIHGKGTGVLRKGVQDYLKRNKHIRTYRLGSLDEGGSGVTVCELK